MHKTLLFSLTIMFLSACGASKNFLERSNQDKALQDAAKQLAKNADNQEAIEAVPLLYKNIQQERLAKIESLSLSNDPARFDRILSEYQYLQDAYTTVLNNRQAFRLINPTNYATQLLETKQKAAASWYEAGEKSNYTLGRDAARQAYGYYAKAKSYDAAYKDVAVKMDQAFEASIVTVVINPIQDDRFFYSAGWGNNYYNYSNSYFQESLVNDLQRHDNNLRYHARFFSDWELKRNATVQPNWVVNLRLQDMNVPYPVSNTYNRQVSASVQNGTDTAGKAIFKNVYATVHITRLAFTARTNLALSIADLQSNRNIAYRNFSSNYNWQQETASYTGDSRALTTGDWAIINNRNQQAPGREQILNELYRDIYPQVKREILYRVD